ncbi:MAG: polymer-forming cytoskeletal protein [Myxococcota bacterium]|jgi:cytoskeletal protein CcmA (bactofilin family)
MGFLSWLKRLFGLGGPGDDEDGPAALIEAPRYQYDMESVSTAVKPKESDMAILAKREEASAGREPSSNINALLGKGSEFEGKLTFEGTVRIDGRFSGEIFSEETLVIGEGARIKAEINVGSLVLYGEVVGNVRAITSVDMHAPARLIGNITTPALTIENGVIFEGACKMENTETRGEKIPFIKKEAV